MTKTLKKQLRKFLILMVKVSLLTNKFKIGFQSFVLGICH